ncbi:hypothetical protein Tco_0690321 [Tanacetum coccineum]
MMLNPAQVYDQRTKTALGVQNPFHLRQAKKAQPALYDGEELLKTHHVPVNVPSSEEELELAETTRNKLHAKMNDSACVENKVNITPPNYSKENFMATFIPQTQLTPEQLFWSIDLEKQKAEELKANASPLPVLPPATVYPPNTPVHLVPRTLPTTSQVNIGLYVITQLFWDFEKTCKKRITPTGITKGGGFEKTKWCYLTKVISFFNLLKEHFDGVQKSLVTEVRAMKAVFENLEAEVDQNEIDLKSSEIKRKNILIKTKNLIVECLSKDVFYTATDSVLNVSRFSDMHDAFTIAQKRIADLESENFNLRNKIQNDDHDSMIKHFSKLEVEHFNLQLKYQNLKERFGNKKPVTSSDDPSFDSLFVIGQLNDQIQSRGNTIRELKEKISRLTKKNSDADPILDLKALVSQKKDLTAKLHALHDLNKRFQAKNAKNMQHYKELYQSVVRQPTAFKSERLRISKPRFASQVDVNNDLSKPVTTHYSPKERESAIAKPHHLITPGSSRWNPTGKIFKTVGLRWVPTGKIFTSSTTKVDSEPLNGSNEDITNLYECENILDVSAGTLNLSAGMMIPLDSQYPAGRNVYIRDLVDLGTRSYDPDPRSRQSRRDPPRDNPLVSVEVLNMIIKKGNVKNKGIVRTEMELSTRRIPTSSSNENLETGSLQFAVRFTWLFADIEASIQGPRDTQESSMVSCFHFSRRSITVLSSLSSEFDGYEMWQSLQPPDYQNQNAY